MQLNTLKRGLQILYQIQVINMKFKYAFKAHSSLFNHGTHYITSIPGLMTFRAQNGMLNAFTDAKLNKKDVYISSEHLMSDGWNDISLDGDSETIKLTVNGRVFTLCDIINKSIPYSGFSDSNYITTPQIFTSDMKSFEIQTVINVTSTSTDNAGIIDTPQPSDVSIRFTVASGGMLYFRVSSDGTTNSYPVALQGSQTLPINTNISVNVAYSDTTGYTLKHLVQGDTNWIIDAQTSDTTKPYISGASNFILGDNVVEGSYLPGSIDIAKTYFKRDGNLVFNGVTAVEGTDYTINGTLTHTKKGFYPTFNLGKLTTYANSWLVLKDIQAIKIEE